jgi:urea transporter
MLPQERAASENGLHGYNGFLVGMGMGSFNARLHSDHNDLFSFVALLLPLLFTSLFCWLTNIAIRKNLSTPPFTFAFNISLSCWLALCVNLGNSSDFYPSFTGGSTMIPIQYNEISFEWFLKTSAAGVGQVFFAPELTPSLIILSGLAVGSPIAAVLAFTGSMVGTSVSIFLHADRTSSYLGINGLSAVLSAIALGGFYFVISWWSILLACLASVFTVAVTHVFSGLLIHPVDGPGMTFPFCVVATILFLAVRDIGIPLLVKQDCLHSCEAHLADYLDNSNSFGQESS